MFNKDTNKLAMQEIAPKIIEGDHYQIGYTEDGRLVCEVPVKYVNLTKLDSYTLDARYNFTELKNTMRSHVLNIESILTGMTGKQRDTFEMIYKIQTIREEVLNSIIPFAKKLKNKIIRVQIRYDKNGKVNIVDSDWELVVNKHETETEEQYTAIVKFV
jgi:hypothetical protein